MKRQEITVRVAEKLGIEVDCYDNFTEEQKAFFNSLSLSHLVSFAVVDEFYSGTSVGTLTKKYGMQRTNIYRAVKSV